MSESKKKRRSSVTNQNTTLENTYVTLFQYNTMTKQNEQLGTFIFTLQTVQNGVQLTIYKQGSLPILSFIVTKQIRWNYQNLIYCYFLDPSRNQFLAVFNDAETAAHVTATIVCSTRKLKTNELLHHDIVKTEGKGISIGDTLLISYFLFPLENQIVQNCIFSVNQKKIQYSQKSMINGLVQSIGGMTTGSTRIVLIPPQMTGYESGTRDDAIPEQNYVAVVILHRVKSADGKGGRKASTDNPLPEIENSGTDHSDVDAAGVVPPLPIEMPQNQSDKSDADMEFVSVDDSKLETIKKLQKMGGKAAMMPVGIPSSVPVSSPAQIIQQQQQQIYQQQQMQYVKETEDKLKHLEERVSSKIDEIKGDEKTASIVLGVITLAKQLQEKQEEIDKLKNELEMTTKLGGVATQRQVEFAQNEASDMRKKSAHVERKLKDAENKLNQLKKENSELQESSKKGKQSAQEPTDDVDYDAISKQKTKQYIKKMMGGVFDEISDFIQEDGSYTGDEISDKLFDLLRKHSLPILDEIKKNGVISNQ